MPKGEEGKKKDKDGTEDKLSSTLYEVRIYRGQPSKADSEQNLTNSKFVV